MDVLLQSRIHNFIVRMCIGDQTVDRTFLFDLCLAPFSHNTQRARQTDRQTDRRLRSADQMQCNKPSTVT